jgi:outer membrane receptor protein involved in Fe transport
MKKYCYMLLLVSLVIHTATALPALMTNPSALDPIDKTVHDEVNLREVEVNASRTQTRLKDLPASVTVVAASALEKNEITTLNNVSALVPNLFMPDYGTKLTSPIYIRGVGSRINSPSVGMYVDNVPYFEKSSFDFDFFDVQKIEVLRGPQGTLYGRNSMGGVINITSRSPFDVQGTHVQLTGGTYGMYKINLGHYATLSDKIGYSISANYLSQDGFHTNVTRGEQADSLRSLGLRLKLYFRFNDNWKLDLTSSMEKSDQSGYPYAPFNKTEGTIGAIEYNDKSGYDRFLFSNSAHLKYSAPRWSMTNTLSYQLLDDDQQIDQDFRKAAVFFAGQLQRQHNLANELIFQSQGTRRYNWLTGLFLFAQSGNNAVVVDDYTTKLWYRKDYLPTTQGAALFHQSTYKLLPKLTLTGGIRFDYEQTSMGYQYQGTRAGATLTPVDTVYPSLTDQVILPKIALSYELTPDIHAYASYSSGYKPGGFNSTFELPEHLMFKKEQSYNYELGIKTAFLTYLFADVSLFYTDLIHQQIYRTVPSGRGSYLDNSGLSNNKGFELMLQNSAFHGFEAALAYGYTHSEILEYVQNANLNYNNKFTPYIPRHTLSVQVTQTFRFENSRWLDKLRLNAVYNQTGELYWNLANTLKEESYGLLNAKVSLSKGDLQLDVWGKNLLNTQYRAFIFESGPSAFAQAGRPMQLGATISYKW